MTTRLGPYNLSATNPQPINVEWDSLSQPPIGVELSNISGLICQVQIGGQNYWLEPWTARYFSVASASIGCEVIPTADISPAQADPLRLVGMVYQIGDTPPSSEVRSLAGLALTAALSSEVTLANGQTVGIDGAVTTQGNARLASSGSVANGSPVVTVNLNPTDRSILVLVSNVASVDVVGNTSNTNWADYAYGTTPVSVPIGVLSVPVFGVSDTSVNVTLNRRTQTGAVAWQIIALPDNIEPGSVGSPLSVINQNPLLVATQASKPLSVAPFSVGNELAASAGLNNQTAQLIAPPPNGSRYFVDTVSFTGNTAAVQVYFGTDAALSNPIMSIVVPSGAGAPPIFHPEWSLVSTGLWVKNSTASTIIVWIGYHQEGIGN